MSTRRHLHILLALALMFSARAIADDRGLRLRAYDVRIARSDGFRAEALQLSADGAGHIAAFDARFSLPQAETPTTGTVAAISGADNGQPWQFRQLTVKASRIRVEFPLGTYDPASGAISGDHGVRVSGSDFDVTAATGRFYPSSETASLAGSVKGRIDR